MEETTPRNADTAAGYALDPNAGVASHTTNGNASRRIVGTFDGVLDELPNGVPTQVRTETNRCVR